MKKLVKILLVLVMINININVFATNDTNLIDENQNQNNNDQSNDNNNQETSGEKSNIATLDEVYINEEKVVCDEKNVCEKVIKDNSINEVLITYKKTDSKAVVSKEKIDN